MIYGTEKSDLTDRMRQFETVCKVAIQTGVSGYGGNGRRRKNVPVHRIGEEQFGLTPSQARVCMGKARNLLGEVSNSVSSETLLISARKRLHHQSLRLLAA